MRKERGKQSITYFSTLLLLGVFAMFLFLVLVQGAWAYERIEETSARAYEKRTAIQYLMTKIHQVPSRQSVRIDQLEQGNQKVDCLIIQSEIEGETYETKIYCYDGWLMELFTEGGAEVEPQDGEKLLKIQALEMWISEGLLWMVITDLEGDGTTITLSVTGGDGL